MRWLAALLQIGIPGPIGAYLALAMGMGMSEGPGRSSILTVIVVGGAVIGLLVWLLGLIAAPASRIRLVWTVALSSLGFLVSYLLIEEIVRGSPVSVVLFYPALAAPLVGAMAGYYWPRRGPRAEGQ